ncbi:MAG: hypothetical protein IJ002_06360 [Clostridia bacterium]|nr:hypothetical protein [Clostridia bacterium]
MLVAVRFLYFGFEYFPQLDDYIQHHNYAPQGSFFYLLERLGLLAARPLAGILDITLWSWLWPCAIVGVLLLSALYALSAIEFHKIFEKLFGTSKFFIVIFAILPLGIEGTYWMSASTRIIPGIFFASLSASLFVKFLEKGKNKDILLTLLFQFFTFCFYEQTAVLSCALNVILAILYCKKSNTRWLLSFGCFGCAILYFLVTSIQSDSVLYSSRTNIMWPTSAYYYDTFLPDLLSQFKSAFLGGGYYTLVYGFIRGVMRIVSDGAWFYCVVIIAACVFFGYTIISQYKNNGRGKMLLPLGIGVLLILAPLAPFFIIENPWFSFRGTVPSFVGIALVCDVVVRLLTKNKKHGVAVFSSFVALIFCICSVSEIADYRSTTEADTKVVSAISTVTSEIKQEFPDKSKVAIFNVDAKYVSELNSYYHEHIHGVTESEWALTGAVQCYNDNPFEGITYVPISLKTDPIYKQWNYSTKNIASMDAVYVYDYEDNTIERLTVEQIAENTYFLYYKNGEKYGTVVEENGCGRFFEE